MPKLTAVPTTEPAPYMGPERRAQLHLSDDQMERIAQRAAELAVVKTIERITQQTYIAIGKGVVQKALTLVGLATVALGVWGVKSGWIKL